MTTFRLSVSACKSSLRPVHTRDIYDEENHTNIAVKSEHVQNICDIALTRICKIAGCSHVRIFLAIEIAEKIAPKIAVNIARVNAPLESTERNVTHNQKQSFSGLHKPRRSTNQPTTNINTSSCDDISESSVCIAISKSVYHLCCPKCSTELP